MLDFGGSKAPTPLRFYFLQILALTGFAVAQPLLELIQHNPEFLSVHQARPADLWIMVVVVFLALPAVLWLIIWLAGQWKPGIRGVLQAVTVGILLLVVQHQPPSLAASSAWSSISCGWPWLRRCRGTGRR